MNMPVLKESERPSWLMGISAVVLGALLTFLITNYFNQNHESHEYNQSVETQLRSHELEIASLKITTTNIDAEERRTESSIAAIEASQANIQSTLQGLKDSNDAQTLASANIREQLNVVNTKLGALDDILRPPRVIPR